MLRKLCATLAIVGATATLLAVNTSSAQASNAATNGCTQLFVEYTSSGSTRYVSYVEASNVCAPYRGYFSISGRVFPVSDPIKTSRQNIGDVPLSNTDGFCADGYEVGADGSENNRGHVCVPLA